MELLLKGKVQKLGTTFGVIKSNDYNELHFFILSDIIDNDKTKIKLGDNVSFELKTNKSRGSNAIKIKILSKGSLLMNKGINKNENIKDPTEPEIVFLGLILVIFFHLNIFPKT